MFSFAFAFYPRALTTIEWMQNYHLPTCAGRANASHNNGALNGIARIKRLMKTSGWGLIES